MGGNESNRVFLTKESIRRALLNQIECQDISHVKASDVIREARVSKATFYRYYKDVCALLLECFATYLEVEEEIKQAIRENDLVDQQYRLTLEGVRKIERYPRLFLMCHKCTYKPFMVDFYQQSISRSISTTMRLINQQGVKADACPISIEQLAVLCIDLSIAVNTRWAIGGCRESPEEVSSLLSICTTRFIESMKMND